MGKKTIRATPKKLSLGAASKNNELIYETDFCAWASKQAGFLKKGEFSHLDIKNLIEEIESLGRSEKRTLISYLEVLLMHMLKVKFQPAKRTASWDRSITVARHKVHMTLNENPSLKPKLKTIVNTAYFSARYVAAEETGLDDKIFPETCPWSLKDIFPDLEKKYL